MCLITIPMTALLNKVIRHSPVKTSHFYLLAEVTRGVLYQIKNTTILWTRIESRYNDSHIELLSEIMFDLIGLDSN